MSKQKSLADVHAESRKRIEQKPVESASAADRTEHVMKHIISAIASEMGYRGADNAESYLALIREELEADLSVLRLDLLKFFARYPFDTGR